MILTLILLASTFEAPQEIASRTTVVRLVPDAQHYFLELEIRADGALIGTPAISLVEGETSRIEMGGSQGYRIELTAAPSPAARYAPEASDDVFLSSRLFLPGGRVDWQRVGDAILAIEPGTAAGAEFAASATSASVSEVSLTYRMRLLTH